jgi:hypothetical protein
MYNTFISIIALVCPDEQNISDYLVSVHKVLKENFQYCEIILINNGLDTAIVKKAAEHLDKDIKKDITVINLSKKINSDNAIVAGLDRANGDYTVIFDMNLYSISDVIVELYKKTQENFDIVSLQYRDRKLPLLKKMYYKAFYYIMNKYSDLTLDINEHNCRIISRRALNSIVKIREKLRYMRGVFSYVGYNTASVVADIPEGKPRFGHEETVFQSDNPPFRSALIGIFSFTNIVSRLIMMVFIVAMFFSCFFTVDAIMIKLAGVDLFGDPKESTPTGYLIILVSFLFSLLFFILFLFSIYLANLNKEIKHRPEYFIKSIQRIE